jgi:Tfp pilus assembly protein PilN
MKTRFPLAFATALLALVAAGGAAYAPQRAKTMRLRAELEQAQANAAELSRLQAENQRLRQKQVAPSELSRLREDHAAMGRLRAELESLQKSAPPAVR